MDYWLGLSILVGLVWGSFLTAFKSRLDDLESLLIGRSKCPNCQHQLGFFDLFPVLSYVFLLGKCRYCKKQISSHYPLIELISVVLALAIYLKSGISISSVLAYLSMSLLLVSSFLDIESQEVPISILIVSVVLALISSLVTNFDNFAMVILAGLTCAFIPAVLSIISREKWMGYGDIFFALTVGFMVGYPASVVSIFLAFLLGSIFGIIYLFVSKKGLGLKAKIAFGPFIALGGFIGYLIGQDLFSLYLKMIGF
jgi:prepilin signal peptidase PulO-like enzyme (type II secretory pathway)